MCFKIPKPNKALEPYQIEKLEVAFKYEGQKQKLLVVQRGKKSTLHLSERDTEYKTKNKNLTFICNMANSKIYYNIRDDVFWQMVRKSNSREVIWQLMEDHDIETILAFSLIYQRQMDSALFGERFFLGKRLKKKMQVLNDRFHKKRTKNAKKK